MTLKLELEPIESASFSESRDTIRNTHYTGFERRIKHRRVTPERRETVRFGETKSDRRDNQDRRNNEAGWKYCL